MKPNIFVSYSRHEVAFVDELVSDLEKQKFNVWLDYRCLVPGTPWLDQIDKGLDESDVTLLVVSKAAVASKNVAVEWQRMLTEKKRVILAIFEAVHLPPELEKYEWVDFRENYNKGIADLVRQLQQPKNEKPPVPETGFKLPAIVWFAAVLSIIIGLLSLVSIWSLFIPFILVPLAYRVFKRDYNFLQVQLALVLLPLALYLTSNYVVSDDLYYLFLYLTYTSIPFVLVLWFVLRSKGMQRWGMPSATLPNFSNPDKPNIPHPAPRSFYVDYAPEDAVTAKDFEDTLKSYGHTPAPDIQHAKAIFTLISEFKNDTSADPQKQVVFPVILQTNNSIPPKLSKVQWIDFRGGVRHLNDIAELLPNPSDLLKALGIRPMGNEMVLPTVIMYTRYFIFLLTILTFGSWLPYINQLGKEVFLEEDWTIVLQFAISLLLLGVIAFLMIRSLIHRRGWFADFRFFLGGIVALGLLILWQSLLNYAFLQRVNLNPDDIRGLSADYPGWIYGIGTLIIAIFMVVKRRDLQRWFPAKSKK
jgi:hypothetical protein